MSKLNEVVVNVGDTVMVQLEDWTFQMVVKDKKVPYGTPRILVVPVNGSGESWINLKRVKLDKGKHAVLS